MNPFEYEALPGRAVFGAGRRRQLGEELGRLGRARAFLIAGGHERTAADEASNLLGEAVAARWDEVRRHVPATLVARAEAECTRCGADVVVSIGGGSAIGLAKAIAISGGLRPIVALPTTYSGSEMTPIWGITTEGRKTTGRDQKALPSTVIYEPELTVTLPASLSATSGLNALAHCAESLYAPGADPVTSLLALEGARALVASLPRLKRQPGDLAARSDALYGAFLAGRALASAGTSVHHKLCHLIGGRYDLPHAELHAVVLPHSLALVEAHQPDVLAPLAGILGAESVASGARRLVADVTDGLGLSDLGVDEGQLLALVPEVMASGLMSRWAPTEADVASFMTELSRG